MVDAFECTDGKPWGESPLTVRPDESILYGNDDALKKAERAKMFMNRDRRLYESVNHSMMANFVDDGFKDEEVQVNESNNKGPTGFSALKYVQPCLLYTSLLPVCVSLQYMVLGGVRIWLLVCL